MDPVTILAQLVTTVLSGGPAAIYAILVIVGAYFMKQVMGKDKRIEALTDKYDAALRERDEEYRRELSAFRAAIEGLKEILVEIKARLKP